MEFDEMKKIWDAQSNKTMYAIDESALHNKVISKRKKSARIAGRSERIMIGALLFSTIIILGASIYKAEYDVMPLVLSAVTFGVAILIFFRRRERLKQQGNFENSISGDIELAISNAEYQIRLSALGKWLYLVVALLSVASVVDTLEEWYKGAFLLLFFIVGYFGARWEHRTFYVSQKTSLLKMRDKLQELKVTD